MKNTLLTFALVIAFGFVGGCSKSAPPAVLGVWADPTGRSMEITRDKWIAKTSEGHATFDYRIMKTRKDGMDVALVDEAGNKWTATVMIDHGALKISRADGQWVVWTRKL
ncbi:MAG: hypothetical protein WDM76_09745 [Limisphaerales bacterium]